MPGFSICLRAARLPEDIDRLVARGGAFDLVFADPPYTYDRFAELLEGVQRLLEPEGQAAIEHRSDRELPEKVAALDRISTRRYGDTCLTFYELDVGTG